MDCGVADSIARTSEADRSVILCALPEMKLSLGVGDEADPETVGHKSNGAGLLMNDEKRLWRAERAPIGGWGGRRILRLTSQSTRQYGRGSAEGESPEMAADCPEVVSDLGYYVCVASD